MLTSHNSKSGDVPTSLRPLQDSPDQAGSAVLGDPCLVDMENAHGQPDGQGRAMVWTAGANNVGPDCLSRQHDLEDGGQPAPEREDLTLLVDDCGSSGQHLLCGIQVDRDSV